MRIKKRFLIPVALLLIIPQFTAGCFSFRMNPSKLQDHFADKNVEAEIDSYTLGKRNIHYAATGDSNKSHVLFLHGAPGSLTAFNDFLTDPGLIEDYRMISVDRPGYGHSNFGNSEPNLKRQAELLKPLLEMNKTEEPTILVGHSLGGPLSVRMAIDYPELVDGLILVAASIDPDLEPEEAWFRKPLYTPFFRWIVPVSFRVTNDEILFLEDQLHDMVPEWENITCPVIVIQGGEDTLVPPSNADFAKKMLINSETEIIMEDDMNHFVPWSDPHLITEALFRISSKFD